MKVDKLKLKTVSTNVLTQAIISICAIVIAVIVGAILINAMGKNPIVALSSLLQGAIGSKYYFSETLVKTAPLLFTGISYAVCSKCGLTNLGMEGQMYLGAIFATTIGVYVAGLPSAIHLPFCLIAGFIGGGIWCLITGILKVYCGASEVITTVMLNSIASFLNDYLINGPMIAQVGGNPQTKNVLDSARLMNIMPGTRLHFGFILGLIFIFLYYIFIQRSKKGYEVRVSGMNNNAALYSGINTKKNILLVTFIAGGCAGLAGTIEILGIQKCIQSAFASGYGYDGIAVSLIGQNSPIGIIFGALLFGAFHAGGNNMMRKAQVPDSIVSVIQALIIISVVASHMIIEILNDRKLKKQTTNEIMTKENVGKGEK